MTRSISRRSGFTLIEILIVIAIISILSSVAIVGLPKIGGKGRDARRVSDMRQVQTALELYFTKNGNYPNVSDWAGLSGALTGAGIGINQVPADPSPSRTYDYCVSGTFDRYMMVAILEEQNGAAQSVGTPPCTMSPAVTCGAASTTYCVTI